jgi:carbamoyltransferase
MNILGLSGGLDPSASFASGLRVFQHSNPHDSAAALLKDGELIAAVEEERLTRIKHTDRFAAGAIMECCRIAHIEPAEIDLVTYYGSEGGWNNFLRRTAISKLPELIGKDIRELICNAFERDLGLLLKREAIHFVDHHLAHASCVYRLSGFDPALVITIDGAGDELSGSISIGSDDVLLRVQQISQSDSLGALYRLFTQLIGFGPFDEYKVMGLAGFGDSKRLNHDFNSIVSLGPNGSYSINWAAIPQVLKRSGLAHQESLETRADFAAAIQGLLERTVLHVVSHFRHATGMENLCLAGGVTLNCSLVSQIEKHGLFTKVFVAPAAHDAGCAMGAAMQVYSEQPYAKTINVRSKVYLGNELGTQSHISDLLLRWSGLVSATRTSRRTSDAAQLLAAGLVIGWAQGRAEFGPRALGNRSILADPRPMHIKDRINSTIKGREEFRPLAPAVIEEQASKYFEFKGSANLPYMTTIVRVKPEWADTLQAITHVDGTARIQTVNQCQNPVFYDLLKNFSTLSGIPILLNTSLNTAFEPIVNSAEDVLATFITSGLDALLLEDWLIRPLPEIASKLANLRLSLPPTVSKHHVFYSAAAPSRTKIFLHSEGAHDPFLISAELSSLLELSDGSKPVDSLLFEVTNDPQRLSDELFDAWKHRLVHLRP